MFFEHAYKSEIEQGFRKRAQFGNNGEKHPGVVYTISPSQCVAADAGFT